MSNFTGSADSEKSLIFLHIPKAAGTTLNRIIERQYKGKPIFSINGIRIEESIAEFKRLTEAQRRELKVLQGHMKFGLHKYFPQPSTYITMLRDPVERIISHYYYVLQTPNHYLYKEVTSKNISLKDYVCSGISLELENDQTRALSGVDETVINFGQCSHENLKIAKKNIQEHFSVVGLAERFDETLLLLQRALGWKTPFYIKSNLTKKRPLKEDVSKETLKLIEKHNELDIELYTYCKEKFEEVFMQSAYSEIRLHQFKLLNQIYSKAYPFRRSVVNTVKVLYKNYA